MSGPVAPCEVSCLGLAGPFSSAWPARDRTREATSKERRTSVERRGGSGAAAEAIFLVAHGRHSTTVHRFWHFARPSRAGVRVVLLALCDQPRRETAAWHDMPPRSACRGGRTRSPYLVQVCSYEYRCQPSGCNGSPVEAVVVAERGQVERRVAAHRTEWACEMGPGRTRK